MKALKFIEHDNKHCNERYPNMYGQSNPTLKCWIALVPKGTKHVVEPVIFSHNFIQFWSSNLKNGKRC